MTQTNKDKADIAIDDAENTAQYAKKMQLGKINNLSIFFRNFSSISDVFSSVNTISEQSTTMIGMDSFTDCLNQQHSSESTARKRVSRTTSETHETETYSASEQALNQANALSQWKRIMLLVIAITVHNIPEGLAVGVSFGAIGTSDSATFEAARNLAIGIGIQNFPEGLAVSLPLHAAGFSMCRAFWYGQLSGMVEPIFGILGAVAVTVASIILPYALSFAAGAMIYIVADDILPEAHTR